MRPLRLTPLVLVALVHGACDLPPESIGLKPFPWEDAAAPLSGATPPTNADADAGVPDAAPFTIVALPDTQYYASDYPQILTAQVRWIVGEHTLGNLAFVLHEGDIVDSDVADQWTVASPALHMLDGVVPYVLSTGNHDYAGVGWPFDRTTTIDNYFSVSSFARYPWFKGTFEVDRIANSYQLLDVPGGSGQWLVLSLEFGPRDTVLAWADGILKQYPTTPAMIVTHAYLYDDNTRYDNVNRPDQEWNPHEYPIGSTPGAVNDGEEMWQKLIVGNSNVEFVLCGHVLDSGVGRLTSVRPDGSVVHQILANYQMLDQGGGGYLRVMQFFPAARTVHVRTYSPFLNDFKTDADNDFELAY